MGTKGDETGSVSIGADEGRSCGDSLRSSWCREGFDGKMETNKGIIGISSSSSGGGSGMRRLVSTKSPWLSISRMPSSWDKCDIWELSTLITMKVVEIRGRLTHSTIAVFGSL